MVEKTTEEIFCEKISSLSYYNLGRKPSDPYFIPHKSDNPIIRFLDWYCGQSDFSNPFNPFCYVILIVFIAGWIFGLIIPFIVAVFNRDVDFTDYCLCIGGITVWLWGWIFLLTFCIFRFDLVYRYFRNRYLVKHLLPGPHGWCSIDGFSWLCQESLIDSMLRVLCRHEYIWQLFCK